MTNPDAFRTYLEEVRKKLATGKAPMAGMRHMWTFGNAMPNLFGPGTGEGRPE